MLWIESLVRLEVYGQKEIPIIMLVRCNWYLEVYKQS